MTSPICLTNNLSTLNGVDVTGGSTVTIKLFDTSGVANWQISCLNTDEFSATTITASSNGIVLPTGTINVVSTAGFNSSGTFIIIGGSTITYTGKTSTSFTGCTGGSGTLSTGQRVSSIVLTIDQITKTATFVAPILGNALIFQSVVNFGVDLQETPQPSYTTTFGVYVLTTSGFRVSAAGETIEGDLNFGWTSKFNNLIRNYTATAGSAGDGMVFSSGAYNVVAANDSITVNPDSIQLKAAYKTLLDGATSAVTASTLVQRTGTGAINVSDVDGTDITVTTSNSFLLSAGNGMTFSNQGGPFLIEDPSGGGITIDASGGGGFNINAGSGIIIDTPLIQLSGGGASSTISIDPNPASGGTGFIFNLNGGPAPNGAGVGGLIQINPGIGAAFNGNVAFHSTPSSAAGTAGGSKTIWIGDRSTAPGTNPSGGLILYSESGVAKIRSGANTVTLGNKPSVTGSKASGAALASLLTVLAAAGLITDSTTA
jgi:hypothetical protein